MHMHVYKEETAYTKTNKGQTQQWTRTSRQKLHKRPSQVSKWYGLKHTSTSVEHLLT